MSLPKWLKKPLKRAAKTAGTYLPGVKVIQATHGMLKVGQAVNQFVEVGDTINENIPAMRIMVGSVCDKVVLISGFATLVQTAGIAANIIQTYQGIQALNEIAERLGKISDTLEAQTALKSRTEFADLVYDELWYRLDETSRDTKYNHWYIVYHPDTIWYSHFHRRMCEKPLEMRFCGYTNSLDMAVIFMLAARERQDSEQRDDERHRKTKLHLLIPGYRLLFIPDFVTFPDELRCFAVEGLTHNSQDMVWLNIPEEQGRFLQKIKNWKPPKPTIWQSWGSYFGLATLPPQNTEPRILGTQPEENASVSWSDLSTEESLVDSIPYESSCEDESHTEDISSSSNHLSESSHHHTREHNENQNESRRRRRRKRHHKSREIRNMHKARRSPHRGVTQSDLASDSE